MTIDDKDTAMLAMLQQNDRITIKEMAEMIHLSPSPTFDRQKRLERLGVIKRYAAVVDHKLAGNQLIVLCHIRLKEQNRECARSFATSISALAEVVECYNISGDFDYLMKIYLRDMTHYEDFVYNHLGTIDSIGTFRSTFVISEVKNSHSLPVYPTKP